MTKDPEYRLHYLRLTVCAPEEPITWDDTVVGVFQADLDGLSFTNAKEITKDSAVKTGSLLVFTVEEMASSDFYNGFTYLDTMNEAEVARFMELTHEQYESALEMGLGKTFMAFLQMSLITELSCVPVVFQIIILLGLHRIQWIYFCSLKNALATI